MKRGLLINNIGTPNSPSTADVKIYLDEFLMDPGVISLPYPLRFILVRGLITPRRSHTSAEKYQQIWTERGSPLMFYTKDFCQGLAKQLGAKWFVEIGMRYGQPSIAQALEKFRSEHVEEVVVAPMYPQFAEATTSSAVMEVHRQLKAMNWHPHVVSLPAFYDDERFLKVQAETIRPFLDGTDHLVFSFHGLPESHLKKMDGCLAMPNCCQRVNACERGCYRAQTFKTADSLASRLGLPKDKWTVSFQSRLGRAKWIGPSTDDVLKNLAERGIKRIAIASPAFVTDCLETLEELGIGARQDFLKAGGASFRLAPCLNAHEDWISAFAAMIRDVPGRRVRPLAQSGSNPD